MRLPLALALVGITLCPSLQSSLAQTEERSHLDRILESGRLRVGTTGDFRPMSFKDPATGDYLGYDIDVVRELATDLGVEVEFVSTDWANLVGGIAQDQYDITTSASMTPDRATRAAFSEPFVEFGTVPIVLAANAGRFSSWASMNQPEVTVAVTRGTIFEEQARRFLPDAQIQSVEPPQRGVDEVRGNRSLVALTSNVEAAALVTTYPELTTVGVEALRAVRPGAFLLARDDQVWINFVDDWVRMNRASGFFQDLEAKWRLARPPR